MTKKDQNVTEICYSCGAALEQTVGPVSVRIRNQCVTVLDFPHARCSGCGERVFSMDQSEKLQTAAADLLRDGQGFLPGSTIKTWRTASGLTQEELERALGVGAKTVTRWERGLVFQSATADRLIRLSMRFPLILDVLMSGELYDRPREASSRLHRGLARSCHSSRTLFAGQYAAPAAKSEPNATTREGRNGIAAAA